VKVDPKGARIRSGAATPSKAGSGQHKCQKRHNVESKTTHSRSKRDVLGKRDVGGKTGSKARSGAVNAAV